ncbi:HNH endonuclease signature motif containing protein [Arthrobacter psychrochitiniphilus]|uniref:DUF222 domain-containing protein n=1 Tax=Arthrobacter psychrochitiniphilus TaxID=291045 RepID=A0A2V3DUV0_9MICC|nr:HNH endonuclease signature motif containing protein [Arthrobacter psychrochitiniphilus]NYG15549.1 hypothetical protein [Arthrobacter psychrochitiniphilus]PXA66952.1 hypothetical protein CVS29_05240 [Arthrobacter psychrochitiniphilus]
MSIPEIDPGDRGPEATQDVASALRAITLPSIEPFGTDSPALEGLPAYVPAPFQSPSQEPRSRLSVARTVYDSAVAALGAMKCLEDGVAACKAALVAQLMGAAAVEGQSMSLDPWQAGICESSAHSELALTLCIPERTAATLAHHSTELFNNHPLAFAQLQAGALSARHAWIIVDEVETLLETPGITAAQTAAFEQRLLQLAPGSSAASFAPKARRTRESLHPATISTRSKAAHAARSMTLAPGKDGMSWLTLHVPSLAAEGIWVKCTRTARALKNRPRAGADLGRDRGGDLASSPLARDTENRTLTQLRVDVAAALLLGQPPLPGFGAEDSASITGASSTPPGSQARPSGYAHGLVDGIDENASQEYLDQLAALQANLPVADPPLPEATVLITVPFLGALGITHEPAELVGSEACSGPVSLHIARKLLINAGSFLRVLTDPATGEPLGLHPERYQLREADKAVLRALVGGCYFPGCPNPVMDTETDHLLAYGNGGQTLLENLRPACKRHHALRHYKDDKNRHGICRSIDDPDRHNIRLRGWTPTVDFGGSVDWVAPSGRKHRTRRKDHQRPCYPTWLEKLLNPSAPPAVAQETAHGTSQPAASGTNTESNASPLEQLLVSYVKKHNH